MSINLITEEGEYSGPLIVESDLSIIYMDKNTLVLNGHEYSYKKKLKYLPDNLIVKGDLIIDNSDITYLPENLVVFGNLHSYWCDFLFIGNKAIIFNDLIIYSRQSLSLNPNRFRVLGNIIFKTYDRKDNE